MVLNLDPETKFLWDTAKNNYGLKKDKFFQTALKDEFFPITALFRLEADFLLKEATIDRLTDDDVKNCMSRGINLLKNRPLREPAILWSFFSRFTEEELQKSSDIVEGDASWEQANENNNKLLRRHFPKGQSMKHKTQYHATQAQHFINGYPREMFNGRCSNDLFREQLEQINLSDKQRIYNFFNI